MSTNWLIVGLGNPGQRYARTRHNIGEMALDVIASQLGLKFTNHRSNNQLATGFLFPGGPKIILIKPNSFMNLSGGPVKAAAKYFNINAQNTIVLHDELDIPFDTLKLKEGGGHGGHNGIRDIAKALETPEFYRVRIGIGRPPGRQEVADFVLTNFSKAEEANLPVLLADAADATETLITAGLVAAQQKFHPQKNP